MNHEALRKRWRRLSDHEGFGSPGEVWLERLMKAWSEPHRHYHNLEHLEECLTHLDEVAQHCHDAVAVELAIWFHDAVYDPRAPDNEEQSAALAVSFLREVNGPLQAPLRKSVEKLILTTKTHEPDEDHNAAILLDIDHAVLGSDPARFQRYEDDVRREYEWVPASVFKEKRASILRSFLDRRAIYQTTRFRDRFEAQARENLEWSIARLLKS